jgi:hypothetical protein
MTNKLPRELTVLLVKDTSPPVGPTLKYPTPDRCPSMLSDALDKSDYELGRVFVNNPERRDAVRRALQVARDIAGGGEFK